MKKCTEQGSKKFTLTEGDYYDNDKEVFVIYFSCSRTAIQTDLLIKDGEGSTEYWDCYLTEVKLVECEDDIQKYRCKYKEY